MVVGPDVTTLKRQLSEMLPADEISARMSNDSIVLEGHGAQRRRRRPRDADRRDLCAGQGRQPALARLVAAGDARGPLRRSEALGADAARPQLGRAGSGSRASSAERLGTRQQPDSQRREVGGACARRDHRQLRDHLAHLPGVRRELQRRRSTRSSGRARSRRLAEPTLVALSGETASFLAGGEFPVPVSRAAAAPGAMPASTRSRSNGSRSASAWPSLRRCWPTESSTWSSRRR